MCGRAGVGGCPPQHPFWKRCACQCQERRPGGRRAGRWRLEGLAVWEAAPRGGWGTRGRGDEQLLFDRPASAVTRSISLPSGAHPFRAPPESARSLSRRGHPRVLRCVPRGSRRLLSSSLVCRSESSRSGCAVDRPLLHPANCVLLYCFKISTASHDTELSEYLLSERIPLLCLI